MEWLACNIEIITSSSTCTTSAIKYNNIHIPVAHSPNSTGSHRCKSWKTSTNPSFTTFEKKRLINFLRQLGTVVFNKRTVCVCEEHITPKWLTDVLLDNSGGLWERGISYILVSRSVYCWFWSCCGICWHEKNRLLPDLSFKTMHDFF